MDSIKNFSSSPIFSLHSEIFADEFLDVEYSPPLKNINKS